MFKHSGSIFDSLAKAAVDSIYAQQQQSQQQPIFVINNSAQPSSGALTRLGNLTTVGGGIAGAGSLGINFGANKATAKLKTYDHYAPDLLNRVEQFNTHMGAPTTAAEKLKAYVEHGTNLIQKPAFTNGTDGFDVIKKVYNNPFTEMIANGSQPNMKWTPELSEHYAQFKRGPAAAYSQLGAELIPEEEIHKSLFDRHKAIHTVARDNKLSLLGTAAARNNTDLAKATADRAVIASKMDTMQGIVKSKVENLIERLRGKGLLGETEDAWKSKFNQRLQLRHDRMNEFSQKALAPQDEILNKLNSRSNFIKDKLQLNQTQNLGAMADASKHSILASSGDARAPLRNAMKDELTSLAKSLPEFAGDMGKGIEGLSREQQLKLVDYAGKTPLGQSLTRSFGNPEGLAFRTQAYGNLSNAIAAPKKILDTLISRFGNVSAKSRVGALLSLPVIGGGLAMRYLGGKQDEANSNASDNRMINTIRKALSSPSVANNSSFAAITDAAVPRVPMQLSEKISLDNQIVGLAKQAVASFTVAQKNTL